jgi:citronellol/citronellal dehydrogenase
VSSPLKDRVVVMSGGSRGIGLAIAEAVAREGARVALLAKTDEPHPRLPGTIHTAAEAIEAAGGEALPVVGDVRDEAQVEAFVAKAVERWGRVDVVVNNASAINLAPIADLEPKRYDLMLDINVRGTFVLTRAALPHLRASDHAHVLTLSPPLSTDPRWLKGHAPYTVAKMGMSMLTLGLAEDEREHGVGANCLWPRTMIATAAVQNLLGGDAAMAVSRAPEIVADAAKVILERDPREATGNTYIDDEVLAEAGVTDLDRYRPGTDGDLALDIFVDGWPAGTRS